MKSKEIKGVLPAQFCPFKQDLSIDEQSYKAHVSYLSKLKGLGGIVANGHAAEVMSLSEKERQKCLEMTIEYTENRVPSYCGVFASNTVEAVKEAKMIALAGADGILLSPPPYFSLGGGTQHTEMAYRFFNEVANATDLPIILFSLPASGGLNIALDHIFHICDTIPNVVAIKENSGDIYLYEMLFHGLKSISKKVSLLTSFSKSLVATLAVCSDGILSGAASVIPESQIAIFEAIKANDVFKAREIADSVWPLVEHFYKAPWTDMHNRMKYVSKQLGRISCGAVRMPLLPLSVEERFSLDEAIRITGIK